MTVRRVVGVLLAFSAVTASPAEGDLRIDLVPAWEGMARPGAVTELEIRLNGGRAGDYVLELSGGEAPLRITASTGPGGAATLWVPYRAAADPFVGVTAYRDGQAVGRAEKRIHHVISGSRVVAVSLADRSRASKMNIALPKSVVLNASPMALPRTPQAYDAIDLLVLDAASLSALDDVRLSALQGYLGGCGKLIVEWLPDNGVQRLRSLSGCGGRFIGVFDDEAPLTLGALRLLEAPTAPLPRAFELARARNPDVTNDIYLPIVVFLCVYLLIMLGIALTTRKALPLLLVPVLAAALAVFAWRERPPRSELIIWSESGGQNGSDPLRGAAQRNRRRAGHRDPGLSPRRDSAEHSRARCASGAYRRWRARRCRCGNSHPALVADGCLFSGDLLAESTRGRVACRRQARGQESDRRHAERRGAQLESAPRQGAGAGGRRGLALRGHRGRRGTAPGRAARRARQGGWACGAVAV